MNDNNNHKKQSSRKDVRKDRDSPPPGTFPRTEFNLIRSSSRLSCESEGQFIPEDQQDVVSLLSSSMT
jgi:hypothetical protein